MELKHDPELLLKATPPRTARGFLDRTRLTLTELEPSGVQVTALLAPVGFGKSAQLAHWRRQTLARGDIAIWYTVDERDEPERLIRGLTYSARNTSGKSAFSDSFLAWLDGRSDPIEAATGWLAEIAGLAGEVLLLLDDVDLLPSSTREQTLKYLLGNTPSNLHIALAARPINALTASGALSIASIARVGAEDLRFRQEETLTVLAATIGSRIGVNDSVRLHELTEGWPLGVQLAAAALRRAGDVKDLLAAATHNIRRYFIDFAIGRQAEEARHLLIRLALFDTIHPDLCASVLGGAAAVQLLLQLQDETPLVLRAEDRDWMRLHPLARDALRERLAELPYAERQVLSRAASTWYAAHDLTEEAAQQSFLAGDVDQAIASVERSTYRMTLLGRSSAVLDWYHRLPAKALDEHPGFWGPVAWAFAMSDQNAQAEPLIERIRRQPNLPIAQLFEADLIAAAAAGFADRIDVEEAIYDRWKDPPTEARPGELVVWANGRAFLELFRGQPDRARMRWSGITNREHMVGYSPVSSGYADYGTGLTYLWEGRHSLAVKLLRPALNRAEHRLGVRNQVTCMLAALLAEACCECDSLDDSRALLAGRMEVIDHRALPDAIIAAYRTLARIAEDEGRQDRALDLLEALRGIGQSRALPRLQAAAQYEIVRLHAKHGRYETAWSMSALLDALVLDPRTHIPAALVPWVDIHAHLARAHAALTRPDRSLLPQALHAAVSAALLAASQHRDGDGIEARFLRAAVLQRQGAAESTSIRGEAVSLAEANGLLRTLREHGVQRSSLPTPARAEPVTGDLDQPARSIGLLTAKEHEILVLLSRTLSNKEVARAMAISGETVKWHIKNLFSKLNAGGRKHAVARGRQLGLI